MRTVLSFEMFGAFGGTETYTLTVAQHLDLLGHEAMVYTPNPGEFAEFARSRGVRVLRSDELPSTCDAVFAQDLATCYELASRYPDAAHLLAVHSRDHALQGVPQLAGACDQIVVFNDRIRRWVESNAWHPPVARLRQPVDLKRFFALGYPRPEASRVLVLSNYLDGARAELIEEACRDAKLKVDWVGVTTRPRSRPEWAIADADIVIGQGRCIVEAMAAGRAAYVYGTSGGDGWVTPDSYPRLEADGFAGLSNESAVDRPALKEDLKRWDRDMGERNRDLACGHHDVRAHVVDLVDLIRRLGPGATGDGPQSAASIPANELARLVRLEWQTDGSARAAAAEAASLRAELDRQAQEAAAEVARLRAELDRQAQETRAARESAAEAQRQLDELVATRRYRIACKIASPLDRARDLARDIT